MREIISDFCHTVDRRVTIKLQVTAFKIELKLGISRLAQCVIAVLGPFCLLVLTTIAYILLGGATYDHVGFDTIMLWYVLPGFIITSFGVRIICHIMEIVHRYLDGGKITDLSWGDGHEAWGLVYVSAIAFLHVWISVTKLTGQSPIFGLTTASFIATCLLGYSLPCFLYRMPPRKRRKRATNKAFESARQRWQRLVPHTS